MEFLHPALWHDHNIDFARWLHPAMWHVALESWQWIHQVAAPCNVIRGSGMTTIDFARWQHLATWQVALGSWHWIRQLAAPCNVAGSSGMTRHWIRPNGRHIGILHLVSISITPSQSAVDMSFCTSFRNFIQIGPPSAENNDVCRFSTWRISAILDFSDQIMGSLKSPIT